VQLADSHGAWGARRETVSHLRAENGPVQFFDDPHAKFLREAWVASKMATVTQADAVSEEWPDFRLRRVKKVYQYEITTADKEGRCVGQEYKAKSAPGFHDWKADLAQMPSAIKRAAQLKAAKPSAPPETAERLSCHRLRGYSRRSASQSNSAS